MQRFLIAGALWILLWLGLAEWNAYADMTDGPPRLSSTRKGFVNVSSLSNSTTSTSGVMLGFGSKCVITPRSTGRVHFEFVGTLANSVAPNAMQTQMHYGTGTAPTSGTAQGASNAGTAIGNVAVAFSDSINGSERPFANAAIVAGLSLNTSYWFDLAGLVGGGTGTVQAVACNAFEF